MRATIGRKFPNPTNISNVAKQTLIPFSSSSSASSEGGGRGRGRGRSDSPSGSAFGFTGPRAPGQPDPETSKSGSTDSPIPPGLGHGRGKPIISSPILPSVSSFISSAKSSSAGRGRVTESATSQPQAERTLPEGPDMGPKKPIFFIRENVVDYDQSTQAGPSKTREGSNELPQSLLSVLSGSGRGKPTMQREPEAQLKEENRHLRARKDTPGSAPGRPGRGGGVGPRMSREEAVKNAVRILSRGDVRGEDGGGGVGSGGVGGGRGRGGFRGRGGRGRGGFRGRERGERGRVQDSDDGYAAGLYLGDNADGEKLAKKIGTVNMNQLVEGFEEMSGRVLPSPLEDEYLEAMHTNYMIEFEPEYLMGEFDSNPDIDEKPPIPLRDALEKMKPFLMAYEGIQSHEEWEEIMEETMERVPLLKEIVDYYSGPDRVTAKKQQEELERVAKTLPESTPESVKEFTNRAVLSLQSNPGWGFDKKCQFMDKLVREVSQHYK